MLSGLVVLIGTIFAANSLPASACSFVPPHPTQVASMPGIAVGVVTSEHVTEHSDSGGYRSCRSVTVRVDSVLAGEFSASVRVATSCGLTYAPKVSRVVVFYSEAGIYGVWEAGNGFESAVRGVISNAR